MPGKGEESDPKAPLAENEEEEFGDPVPANIQAWTSLSGVLSGVLLMMGLASSEWSYAVDDFYYQGLFIYCARDGFNDTYSGELDDDFVVGCNRIDVNYQGYTLFVALLVSVALACVIFGTMMAQLGSWVQDIDSKRKVYRLSLYLMIVSFITNFLSLIVYGVNFDDVIEDNSPLGPFQEPGDEWEFGWSFKICAVALVIQLSFALLIAYGLLLFPIVEVVEDEEGAAGGDK